MCRLRDATSLSFLFPQCRAEKLSFSVQALIPLWVRFLVLSSVSLVPVSVSVPVSAVFVTVTLWQFEIRIVRFPALIPLLGITLANWDLLWCQLNFGIAFGFCLFSSCVKDDWSFDEDGIESVNYFR